MTVMTAHLHKHQKIFLQLITLLHLLSMALKYLQQEQLELLVQNRVSTCTV